MSDLNEECISELLRQNKILSDTVNYAQENYLKAVEDNNKLRQLLKECRTAFETYAKEDESCGLEEENKYAKHLLPRINAAIVKVRSDEEIRDKS